MRMMSRPNGILHNSGNYMIQYCLICGVFHIHVPNIFSVFIYFVKELVNGLPTGNFAIKKHHLPISVETIHATSFRFPQTQVCAARRHAAAPDMRHNGSSPSTARSRSPWQKSITRLSHLDFQNILSYLNKTRESVTIRVTISSLTY